MVNITTFFPCCSTRSPVHGASADGLLSTGISLITHRHLTRKLGNLLTEDPAPPPPPSRSLEARGALLALFSPGHWLPGHWHVMQGICTGRLCSYTLHLRRGALAFCALGLHLPHSCPGSTGNFFLPPPPCPQNSRTS